MEAARAPAEAPRPPAEQPAPVVVAVPHEERVPLAADAAETWLPQAKPAPGNPMLQPLAVSDGTLDRLAASTEDRFVRDTVVAVRRRQFPYHAYYRARAEEDHHAPAINREHARLVAEHEQATRRRWWQLRRPESPRPAWEDAARKVIERSLPEVRRVFEKACAQVPEFQERWAVDDRADAAVRAPAPAVPVPSRAGEARPPARTREPLGAAEGPTGARGAGGSAVPCPGAHRGAGAHRAALRAGARDELPRRPGRGGAGGEGGRRRAGTTGPGAARVRAAGTPEPRAGAWSRPGWSEPVTAEPARAGDRRPCDDQRGETQLRIVIRAACLSGFTPDKHILIKTRSGDQPPTRYTPQ